MTQKARQGQEQMLEIVSRCIQGNFNRKEFCEKEGIAVSKFYYWHKKYLEQNAPKESGFIMLKHEKATRSSMLKISYPNGVELQIPQDIDMVRLKGLLQLM